MNAIRKKQLWECVITARQHLPNHPQWDCYKHYSFIFQNGKMVEWGCNRGGEPLIGYPEYGKTHSETNTYFKARGLLKRDEPFSIVNIRMNKGGELRLSRPCVCCQTFLAGFGCKTAWFSTESGFAKMELK